MATRNGWSEEELVVVLDLYHRKGVCQCDPEIDELAKLTGRTPASIVMRLANFVAVDPTQPGTGLNGIGREARQMFATYPESTPRFEQLVTRARAELASRIQGEPSELKQPVGTTQIGTFESLLRRVGIGSRQIGQTDLQTSREIDASTIRERLVQVALEWEEAFGVIPSITCAVSELDAAMLVGHTPESFGKSSSGRTNVTKGWDFVHNGIRYQVKANRPSGKPGSFVTLVPKAANADWDRLIWLLYDRNYVVQEAWEWKVEEYAKEFGLKSRLAPSDMRRGLRIDA